MWVKRDEYIGLRETKAQQLATIDWLRLRVNQLERRCALLDARVTGIDPIDIPQFERIDPGFAPGGTATPPKESGPSRAHAGVDRLPTPQDILAGNISFEDMGDDAAKRHGIDHDDSGYVTHK